MQFLENILPKEAMDRVKWVHDKGVLLYEQAQEQYKTVTDYMKEQIELSPHIPDHLRPIAIKVVDALPETLFTMSIVTGTAVGAAAVFWAMRAIQIFTPIAKKIIEGEITKESFEKSAIESGGLLMEGIERFKPAMLVSCGVVGLVHGCLGIATMDHELVVRGTVFALAAYMAYQSIEDAPQKETSSVTSTPTELPSATTETSFVVQGEGAGM
ncbi:MAG: hypothetical protein JSR46_02765 [Verrucomicrobia bacterium]|nr:hypothetical protein [Verrucomicrobiota bacterium]